MSGPRDTKSVVGIWLRILGVLHANLHMFSNSWMRILLVFFLSCGYWVVEGLRQQCHWKIMTLMSLEKIVVNPYVIWEFKYLVIGEIKSS